MKKISTISFIFLLILISSCEDFLDNQPMGYLTTATFPTTSDDAVLATYGVYNTLRIWDYHTGGFPLLDIMSDEAAKGSNPGDASFINSLDNFTFSPTEGSFQRWWSTLYQGIRRAHIVMENIPDIDMDETLKAQLIAEVRFLRAYFYFDLVRAFGDVPKVLVSEPPKDLERSLKDEIYDEIIIPDLLFAIENLPTRNEYSNTEIGRATKQSAQAVLAKVYLFREDFPNCEIFAQKVINSGLYSLDSDFSNVFFTDGEFGSGSLFEIGAVADENFSNGGSQYGNTWGVRGEPNLGWGFGRPTFDLIQFFGNDPRKDASIVFVGEIIEGDTIYGDISTPDTTYNEDNTEILEIECYNQKTYTGGNEPRYSFGFNRRLLRYADVLLMAAEALNENGKSADALEYLNLVRERARGGNNFVLPDITTTNQSELQDSIWDERHRELALEGHRFWDLVRSGKAQEVLGPLGFVEGKHELMPIPQNEIDISDGRITQNDGYY